MTNPPPLEDHGDEGAALGAASWFEDSPSDESAFEVARTSSRFPWSGDVCKSTQVSFFWGGGARRVGMVMHAMWMINDRNERDTCICQKEKVASSGHLVKTHAKPLLQDAPTDVREWSRHHDGERNGRS